MAYKIRPGVEMIQVCGQSILVATRSLWKEGPSVRPVPPLWSICWKFMEPDETDRKPVETLAALFHKSENEFRERLCDCFATLHKEGFLIEVPDEEIEHDGE